MVPTSGSKPLHLPGQFWNNRSSPLKERFIFHFAAMAPRPPRMLDGLGSMCPLMGDLVKSIATTDSEPLEIMRFQVPVPRPLPCHTGAPGEAEVVQR